MPENSSSLSYSSRRRSLPVQVVPATALLPSPVATQGRVAVLEYAAEQRNPRGELGFTSASLLSGDAMHQPPDFTNRRMVAGMTAAYWLPAGICWRLSPVWFLRKSCWRSVSVTARASQRTRRFRPAQAKWCEAPHITDREVTGGSPA